MKSISVVNQKGGVGKTTTAINLATSLVSIGKRVLILDFDPQGNAATGLGFHNAENNAYDFITEKKNIIDCIKQTQIENLDIIPATIDLAAAEFEIFERENPNLTLKNLIEKDKAKLDYDFLFIDCPPSLGMLTINAMSFCDKILIPMQCEFFAMDGLSKLFQTFQRIKQNFNKNLEIEGVVLTMYDIRNRLTKQIEEEIRNSIFKDKVYQTVIPRNVRISEAPSHGLPILMYDLDSTGADAYIQLAKEFTSINNIEI